MYTKQTSYLIIDSYCIIQKAAGHLKTIFGFGKNELIGKSISEIYEQNQKFLFKKICKELLQQKLFKTIVVESKNIPLKQTHNLLIQNVSPAYIQVVFLNIVEEDDAHNSIKNVAENLPIPVLCYNQHKEIKFMNAAFNATFIKKGIQFNTLEDFYTLIRPPKGVLLKKEITDWFKLVAENKKKKKSTPSSKKAWLLCKNGIIRLFDISFSTDEEMVYVIFNDITNNHQETKTLANNEARFRVIANNIPISIGIHDLKGNVVFVNRFFTQQIGYKVEDVPTLSDWYKKSQPDPVIRKQLQNHWLEIIDQIRKKKIKKTPNTEASLVCKDGITRNFSFVFQVQDDYVYVILVDITKRVKAEYEVGEYNQQLLQLTSHLFSVREQERKHTAQEIQEALGQHITGLRLEIAWIKKNIEKLGKIEFQIKMQKALTSMSEAMTTVRKIASGLRPSILDDLGLVATIEWYIGEVSKQSGISIKLHAKTNNKTLERDLKIRIFRIFQEVITQLRNTGLSTYILVKLEYSPSKVILSITDDGNTFLAIQKKPTLGWLSIRETIRSLHGKITAKSSNYLLISIPIKLSHEDSYRR